MFNPKALNRRMTKAGLVAAVLFCVVLGCVVLPSHVQASQNCFLGVSSQCSAWNPLHVNASWVEQQLQLEFANNSVFGPRYFLRNAPLLSFKQPFSRIQHQHSFQRALVICKTQLTSAPTLLPPHSWVTCGMGIVATTGTGTTASASIPSGTTPASATQHTIQLTTRPLGWPSSTVSTRTS